MYQESEIMPKWAREIKRFASIKSQFVLWGNIYDVYQIETEGHTTVFTMNDYLRIILKDLEYKLILNYEPTIGFSLLSGDVEIFKSVCGDEFKEHTYPTLSTATGIIEKLINGSGDNIAVIIKYGSRLPEISPHEFHDFSYKMLRLFHGETGYNLLFWLIEKENDLPAWYTINNTSLRVLSVPEPDYTTRKIIVEAVSRDIPGYNDLNEIARKENIDIFVDQTTGLLGNEIVSIVGMCIREKITFSMIPEAIKRYKLGVVENSWAKIEKKRLKDAETILKKRVIGQDKSVNKVADIIKRSFYNLSGAQYSKISQKPKGVLFFAGPTGVGKTELAKSITELLFGSETSYIRFDMSEFSQEHSDQRLIGAPPGYTGFDVGGELTNRVKQNPFSVILFDEIEKAHHKILDIFLQILDDGRLTSGRGETVYFSESLIIFTSNLGINEKTFSGERRRIVSDAMSYEVIEEKIITYIENYFEYEIRRPELLNRIGKNIVVFDYIRRDVAVRILEKMLDNVSFKLKDDHNIKLEINSIVIDKLKDECCKDLSMGGRGVGNKLEEVFMNPLSRTLVDYDAEKGDNFEVNDFFNDDVMWKIKLTRI